MSKNIDWDKEPLTEDGKLACTLCKGKKTVLFRGKEGGCNACCYFCGESTGLRVQQLKNDLMFSRSSGDRVREDYKKLQESVKENSNCKTCGGDQNKTFGGRNCEECGIVGMCPWPG